MKNSGRAAHHSNDVGMARLIRFFDIKLLHVVKNISLADEDVKISYKLIVFTQEVFILKKIV